MKSSNKKTIKDRSYKTLLCISMYLFNAHDYWIRNLLKTVDSQSVGLQPDSVRKAHFFFEPLVCRTREPGSAKPPPRRPAFFGCAGSGFSKSSELTPRVSELPNASGWRTRAARPCGISSGRSTIPLLGSLERRDSNTATLRKIRPPAASKNSGGPARGVRRRAPRRHVRMDPQGARDPASRRPAQARIVQGCAKAYSRSSEFPNTILANFSKLLPTIPELFPVSLQAEYSMSHAQPPPASRRQGRGWTTAAARVGRAARRSAREERPT